jgi:hypothetical protein
MCCYYVGDLIYDKSPSKLRESLVSRNVMNKKIPNDSLNILGLISIYLVFVYFNSMNIFTSILIIITALYFTFTVKTYNTWRNIFLVTAFLSNLKGADLSKNHELFVFHFNRLSKKFDELNPDKINEFIEEKEQEMMKK